MADKLDTSTSVRVYKPKSWMLLINILSSLFFGIVIGLPLLLLLTLSIFILQNELEIGMIGAGFLCFLSPFIILMSLVLVQQLVNVVSQFFSYVKVSSAGLEQRIWPYKHIRCNWSDVDRIGKWWLFIDAVYLNSCEIIGPSLSLKKPFKLLRFSSQNFMALSGYRGWPEGQLADDVRQFAPQLFNNKPDTQKSVSGNEQSPLHPSGLSQEERLLATLSHVSVLFSYVGIVIPIVIWATQKQRSTYLAFQALQASVLQATMLIFNFMVGACLMCAAFAPIFMIPLAESDTVSEIAFGGMFVAIMIATLLMTFGNLIFVVCGIIGAIMSYQGKDFRYAIIANRLEKRGVGFSQQGSS